MSRIILMMILAILMLNACGRLDPQTSQAPVFIVENSSIDSSYTKEELCEGASLHLQNCFQLDTPVKGINLACDPEMAKWITEASCDELQGVTPMHGWYGFFDWFEQSACNLGWAYYCTPEGCAQDEPLDSCSEYENFNDCQMCEMYSCLESEHDLNCGQRGYFRGYGKKYCERFSAITGEFMSDAGRLWLADVRECLLGEVERIIEKTSACSGIRQEAFDSHPQCYIDSGLCSLPPGDWAHIVATISPWDNDLKQVILSGAGCLQEWTNN
ncbi:MAG: hypothetical protein HOI23_21950 [Deltaproteobacteria bacterium]|jgi:hypothetical protein|nr:hypothetical protein [Deltaproteobacteria bacterium]MBT6431911.1 hypothetical protein [Deltaproteobacteria bacterium]MBT6490900.1 hypothetical protein [Deltaproteobacteria bacterium]